MFKFTVTRVGQVTRSAWRKMLKEVYAAGAEHWHDRFSAEHFKAGAAQRYGYHPRTRKYLAQKRSVRGHTLPLVWTGASRTLASIKDIRSTATGGRAVIHARGLNRRARGMTYSMAAEMVRLTSNEKRSIIAAMKRRLSELLKAAGVNLKGA